jgi:2-amino-4-hydroxy-6-hydroxymethyldihydropteridine diphosphokinase
MPSDGSVRAFIGLGSNVGDRAAHIEAAIAMISSHPAMELVRRTALDETAPWGDVDQRSFLNAVVEVRTTLEPMELLAALKRMEGELGRSPTRRWGPREIDLDILLLGGRIVREEHLEVPHPRLTERRFVLDQLLSLDADLIDPRSGMPLSRFF